MKIKQKFKNTNYLPHNNIIHTLAIHQTTYPYDTKKCAKKSYFNGKQVKMAVNFITICVSVITIYVSAVTICGNLEIINGKIEKVKGTKETMNGMVEKVNVNFVLKHGNPTTI